MFILNTTIDDSSPLIIYSPAGDWAQGDADDIELKKYWGKSYTYTWNANAQASFTFNGTGIIILGGKRSVRGSYTVDLDGVSTVLNATTADPGEYQAVLFNATGLRQTQHTVIVKNMDKSVDIDCIHWWSTVGNGELQELSPEVDDDAESMFHWHPEDAWSSPLSNISRFSNATGQFVAFLLLLYFSTYQTAAPRLKQEQQSITHSQVPHSAAHISPQNRIYTVRLDNAVSRKFSAQRDTYETRALLFQADNLGGGTHTLSLVNEVEGGLLQIDYAQSYADHATAVASTVTSTASSSVSPSGHSVTPPLKAGVAAAIAVASVAFIALLVAIWLLLRRNKTLWTRLQSGYMVQSQFDSFNPSTHAINAVSTTRNDNFYAGNSNDITSHNPMLQANDQPLMSETRLVPNRPDNIPPLPVDHRSLGTNRSTDNQRPGPARSETLMTASTLVAENGSDLSRSNTRTMKLMTQWTALRESSSRTRSRMSDSQTQFLTDVGEPSVDEIAVERDHLLDEIDSLLNDVRRRPRSTDSQPPGYWQATHSTVPSLGR
ncbi:uncharacterized protein EV420DRAFT_1696622 [Desarmillaria tabescens]|uniref:Uncharacterized protein n=1 Tax=Armillaria tabescens TaxID=1929756 RepID=A0AA39K476_ARMTA|nr:uncharacterized protein EV420DRAFT_1696622 [Desarmillaria tabescens]KAK0454047.1 hypothetical protein EV420DRAFT_1696622 [Desarmillaria tabescens]